MYLYVNTFLLLFCVLLYKYNYYGGNGMNFINLIYRNPNTLFTYWTLDNNLSENFDKHKFNFSWNESRLTLKITNLSLNSSFFIGINDLSNQWYIDIKHSDSIYIVELGRQFDKQFVKFCESNECYVPACSYIYESTKVIEFRNISNLNIE